VKRPETIRAPDTTVRSSSRAHQYQKVHDNRKQPIRGLWRRNGTYLARLTVEDAEDRKSVNPCADAFCV
jgi:hypothetical protein